MKKRRVLRDPPLAPDSPIAVQLLRELAAEDAALVIAADNVASLKSRLEMLTKRRDILQEAIDKLQALGTVVS